MAITQQSGTEPSRTEPSRTEPSRTEPSRTEPSRTESSGTGPSGTGPSGTETSGTEPGGRIVGFRRMQDGTREDYALLDRSEREYARGLPDSILRALEKLDHALQGYPVSRLEHSLQAATRARNDGADDELVVAALIHDLGDELAPYNHAEVAAAVLRPYVRPEVTWIVEQHGLFQSYYYAHHTGGDRNARDRFRDHAWYGACKDFCATWDQCSFDPTYEWHPLSSFEPLLRSIFSRPAHDPRYVGGGERGGAQYPGQ